MKAQRTMPGLAAIAVLAAVAVAASGAWAWAAADGSGVDGSRGDIVAGDFWVEAILVWTLLAIELAGVAVIVIGAVVSTYGYLRRKLAGEAGDGPYQVYRANMGRSILLGLEFLIAADIIATVAVRPTLDSVLVLAGIVLIRTFLSLALEVEIGGRWPWRGGARNGASMPIRSDDGTR